MGLRWKLLQIKHFPELLLMTWRWRMNRGNTTSVLIKGIHYNSRDKRLDLRWAWSWAKCSWRDKVSADFYRDSEAVK